MLKRWVVFPLRDARVIEDRLDVWNISSAIPNSKTFSTVSSTALATLSASYQKVAVGRVSPREVVQLKTACRPWCP
mgnify:CR=1 FL=1